MITLEFDKNGYLSPSDLIELSVEELKSNFVDSMREKVIRKELMDFYIEYNKKLVSIIKCNYIQWIDGSFVTKALHPKDVDLVSFIDYSIVNQHLSELENLIYPVSFEKHKMDAYIVRTYPETHDRYFHSKSDSLYWMHHFLKTKPDKYNRSFYKGFIKVKYSYEKQD